MTRIEEIEANVAKAKIRQDVNDSGLLAVLIASDIPYLIAEVKRMQEELSYYMIGDFNNQENIAALEAENKRMREALEGLLLGIEKTAGRHNPAVRDASEKARAAEARVAHLELLEAGHRENAADDIADLTAQIEAARNEGLEMAAGKLAEILQDRWNDWCADTGCFPGDFTMHRKTLSFRAGTWAEYCANDIRALKSTAPVRDDARSQKPAMPQWDHDAEVPPLGEN